MKNQNFGFYFEEAGLGAAQGAITPAEQFFEGSRAEDSLVRETGQNSIDARAGEAPVEMTFELASMDTALIPGIEGLRKHLEQVEVETQDSQGHDSMLLARDTAAGERVFVLRIGDEGTKGLSGSESINAPKSSLSALTRGAGISADDGKRGGSFGIGSAVGPMASDMNTVLYTSMAQGSSEVIFAGYSSLATHRDLDGKWRVGDGFYTDLNVTNDFSYERDPGPIGPFSCRTKPGTDLYVLGYRKAEADPDLQHIKVAFMRNFLVAIDRGNLIVHGVTETGSWTLDKNSLSNYVKEDAESMAFYRAIYDPEPISVVSPRFGKLSLYINVDDSLNKSMHTVTMREPLMKIDTFRHNSIPVKYAAILECSDEKGNKLLRSLEPPQHHKWDPERGAGGRAALDELKKFVREGLQSRVRQQIGEQVEIKNLSRYLPEELSKDLTSTDGRKGIPKTGRGSDKESSTVRGKDSESSSASIVSRKKVNVSVKTGADSNGESTTEAGKKAGGVAKRVSKGGNRPETGEKGTGSAKIAQGNIRFRSWTNPQTKQLFLALTPSQDVTGDLEIVALGPGGAMEEEFKLPIASVLMITSGNSVMVNNNGNVLTDLELRAGTTTKVQINLTTNHRYRVGVK